MKKSLMFTSASVALLAAASAQAALNLVQDPGFEGGETGPLTFGTSPWQAPVAAGGSSTVINTTFPANGSWAAELTSPSSGSSSTLLLQSVSGVTLGTGYSVSFSIADPSGPGGTLSVLLGGTTVATISVSSNSLYTTYNVNGTPSSGNILDFSWLASGPSPASLFVDNVGVAVPEPTTMIAGALMLLPFAASTLRLRKKVSA